MQSQYVQERLESLESIDLKLCAMLQEASQVVFTFTELKRGNKQVQPQFSKHVTEFYSGLEQVSSNLRQEIELLDENVGRRLLPINNVNKKAMNQDDDKLQEQVKVMQHILDK